MKNINIEKIKKLYKLIKEWGIKNGIIQNAKVNIQFLKTISEKSEISKAFLEQDLEEFKDGIGDTFVTIVMVTEIIKKEYPNLKLNLDNLNIENNVKTVIFNIVHLDVEMGEVADFIAKNQLEKAIDFLNKSLIYLSNLAIEQDLKFEDCVQTAYNVIKDRKGFLTPDGTFVKNTDKNYEEIVKKYLKED